MRHTKTLSALLISTALATGAASAETLIFGTGNPPGSQPNTYMLEPWIQKVQEEAGDAFTLIQRDGPALVTASNAPDRVADDIVQISWMMTVFNPGRFRGSLSALTPFYDLSAQEGAGIFCQLYEEGWLDGEFADFQPLFFIPFPQNFVHSTEPFTSFEDLEGRKMMAEAPPVADFLGGYGATVLSIPLIDQYQAMQRGTADGNVITYTVYEAMQMKEVAKHHYEFPMGSAIGMVFMDKDRYEGLSDEARAVLDANSGCDVSMEAGARIDQWAYDVKASMIADGDHTFTTPTSEDVAMVRKDHLQNVVEGYAGFTKDINGRAIIERWIELADEALAAR